MGSMDIVALFVVYSFIGWIIDSTYRSLVDGKWVSQSYFKIPFTPIYGFGALFVLWLHPMFAGLSIGLAGLAYGLILALWEYVGGLFCVHVLHTRLWTYDGPWAIGTHTHMNRIFAWGGLALLALYVFNPLLAPVVSFLTFFAG